jgi:hypothetical protein
LLNWNTGQRSTHWALRQCRNRLGNWSWHGKSERRSGKILCSYRARQDQGGRLVHERTEPFESSEPSISNRQLERRPDHLGKTGGFRWKPHRASRRSRRVLTADALPRQHARAISRRSLPVAAQEAALTDLTIGPVLNGNRNIWHHCAPPAGSVSRIKTDSFTAPG